MLAALGFACVLALALAPVVTVRVIEIRRLRREARQRAAVQAALAENVIQFRLRPERQAWLTKQIAHRVMNNLP